MNAEPAAYEVPAIAAAVVLPEPPNPAHGVLEVCGIVNAANCNTFINIEGLDSAIKALGP